MEKGKFDFYVEYEKMEKMRSSSFATYLKSPLLIIIVLVLISLTVKEGTSNSTKMGSVGDVGGSITIYNTAGKQVPKGHINVNKYNKIKESEFLDYLGLMDTHHDNIKLMLVSLNDRIITLSDETSCYANRVDNDLDHSHITFWYKECGDGYIALNGDHIPYADVKESLGKVMYPDLTKLLNHEEIVPCIYIGK